MAKDIEIALSAVQAGASVAAARGGRLLGSAEGRGILPLLRLLGQIGQEASGAAIVDRVVGKAAAMVMASARVGRVHALLMSKPAGEFLSASGVAYTCDKMVAVLKDRTGEGMCPMEQLSAGRSDPDGLRRELEERFLGALH